MSAFIGNAPSLVPLTAAQIAGAGDALYYRKSEIDAALDRAAPIGRMEAYAGLIQPTGWLFCYGQNVSRATYAALFNVLTGTDVGTTTSGSTTISALSSNWTSSGIIGAKIEGAGIPAGATITGVTSSTLTISAAATASASGVALRILPHGNGDGSTTFTLPDARGRSIFGRDAMGGSAASRLTTLSIAGGGDRLGLGGGDERMQSHTHTINDPGHDHTWWGSDQTSSTGNPFAPFNNYTSQSRQITTNSRFTGISINSSGSGGSQNLSPALVENSIIYAGV